MATIKLTDGREIRLDTFYQYYTYWGLLAGRPNEKMNQDIVERTVKLATGTPLLSSSAPVVLIPPKIKLEPTGLSRKGAKPCLAAWYG